MTCPRPFDWHKTGRGKWRVEPRCGKIEFARPRPSREGRAEPIYRLPRRPWALPAARRRGVLHRRACLGGPWRFPDLPCRLRRSKLRAKAGPCATTAAFLRLLRAALSRGFGSAAGAALGRCFRRRDAAATSPGRDAAAFAPLARRAAARPPAPRLEERRVALSCVFLPASALARRLFGEAARRSRLHSSRVEVSL